MIQNQAITGTGPPVHPAILLMEDEASIANGLQMILQEQGYTVDVAMTGRGALEKAGLMDFDLLVADLRLPDMDGMEVVRQVRQKHPETETIVITGYPSVSSAVESVKAGVSDYLRKPFTEDEFKGAVESALKKRVESSLQEIIVQSKNERLIQRMEVIRVLNRACEDMTFWHDLMETGPEALSGYDLSAAAKAAILSGDVGWIRKHVGELTREQLEFLYKRLEREAW